VSTPAAVASPAAPGAPATFTLTAAAAGRCAAQGQLTFATARGARQQGLAVLRGAIAGPLEIDCSAVSLADSAGLAVLLDWLSAAKGAGQTLRYTHLPEDVVALARISEVDELLARGV
jgi:phospholipid transport system transporter-binding protein